MPLSYRHTYVCTNSKLRRRFMCIINIHTRSCFENQDEEPYKTDVMRKRNKAHTRDIYVPKPCKNSSYSTLPPVLAKNSDS
jgi:hypothetical protein